MAPFTVVGLGDPVLDMVASVSADFLRTSVDGAADGCVQVSAVELATLLESLESEPVRCVVHLPLFSWIPRCLRS